eukprot:COSAG03_NODE_1064_length_4925_cov_1382.405097_3_plen_110_part_00
MTEQNTGECRDCDPDVVDAPTKAFRRHSTADGQQEETVLTGSVNWGSRAQIGPTLDTVKHNCDVYYNASWRQEPELYASREWIQVLHAPRLPTSQQWCNTPGNFCPQYL